VGETWKHLLLSIKKSVQRLQLPAFFRKQSD
jgi:hypothetical protein